MKKKNRDSIRRTLRRFDKRSAEQRKIMEIYIERDDDPSNYTAFVPRRVGKTTIIAELVAAYLVTNKEEHVLVYAFDPKTTCTFIEDCVNHIKSDGARVERYGNDLVFAREGERTSYVFVVPCDTKEPVRNKYACEFTRVFGDDVDMSHCTDGSQLPGFCVICVRPRE